MIIPQFEVYEYIIPQYIQESNYLLHCLLFHLFFTPIYMIGNCTPLISFNQNKNNFTFFQCLKFFNMLIFTGTLTTSINIHAGM